MGTALLLLILIGLYFIPAMVANGRHHPNISGITLLNLLAGWTFLGWIAALVMACGEVKPTEQPMLHCQKCGADWPNTVTRCARCGTWF